MRLVVDKDMKNNAYNITLQVLDITDTDREQISDFGEPIVNVGGIIKGQDVKQEYVALQVPKTEAKLQDLLDPVDGSVVTDVNGEPIQEEIQVPVLDTDGNPIMEDKLDEQGKPVFQLIETPIEVVIADLGKDLCKFPSEFPLSRSFAVAHYGEKAEQIALAYVEMVKEELSEKIAELNTKVDTFSGKVEYQL